MFSGSNLSRAADDVFECGQLLDTHGAARVQSSGRYADFRAHAEFAAIGELGRGIVHHDRGIDRVQEPLRRRRVFGHDGIGMVRAIGVDVIDRAIQAVDLADR